MIMGLQKEKLIDKNLVTKISMTTGVVDTYEENVYDRITHLNNINFKISENETHILLGNESGSFFFLFYNRLDKLKIDAQFKARFIYLASYLEYGMSNIVTMDNRKKDKITYNDLYEILGLSKKMIDQTIDVLSKSGLLIKKERGYLINQDYCIRGECANKRSSKVRVFVDGVRSLYMNTNHRSHKQLYYLFKLLPYVDLQSNLIAFKDEFENAIPLNSNDIAKILNVNINNPSKNMKMLKSFIVGKKYAICEHSVGDKKAYSVNPRLYYMGNDISELRSLLAIFDKADI